MSDSEQDLWRRSGYLWWIGLGVAFAAMGLYLRGVDGAAFGDLLPTVPALGLLVLAQTLVLRMGFADPSIAPVSGLAGVAAATICVRFDVPLITCLVLALVIGLLVGTINGVTAARTGALPALGASIGIWIAASYLAERLAKGLAQTGDGNIADDLLVGGDLLAVPIGVAILVAIAVLAGGLLSARGARRALTIARSGPQASSTLAVVRSFAAAGTLAGLAGFLDVAMRGSAVPAPESLPIPVLAAALLGGASLLGGFGGVGSALVGTVVLLQIWQVLAGFGAAADSVVTIAFTVAIGVLATALDFARRRWLVRQLNWTTYVRTGSSVSTPDSRLRAGERAGRSIGWVLARLGAGLVAWWLCCLVEAAVLYFVIPDSYQFGTHVYVTTYTVTLLVVVGLALLRTAPGEGAAER